MKNSSNFRSSFKSRAEFKSRKSNSEFEYLTGYCGNGKTEILITDIVEKIPFRKRFIYAVPSIDLCDEISVRFSEKGVVPTVIHSKNGTTGDTISVSKRINSYMHGCNPDEGQCLIITHEALRNLTHFPNCCPKNTWTVVHDESYDPTKHYELNLAEHQYLIDRVIRIPKSKMHLDWIPCDFSKLGDTSDLLQTIRNPRADSVYEIIRDLYQDAYNGHHGKCDMFVGLKDWRGLKDGSSHRFVAVTVYNPSQFNDYERVIFAGAFFENELMYSLWKYLYDVEWKPSDLQSKVNNSKHTANLVVKYVFDNLEWSRYRAETMYEGKRVIDHINEIATSILPSKDVVFLGNKNESMPNSEWTRADYNCRGTNQYMDRKNLYYSGAFNHSSSYYGFMKWAGCEEIAKLSQNNSHCYQQVLRTEPRNQGSLETVTVMVPCRSMIEPMKDAFENISFDRIETPIASSLRSSVVDKRKNKSPVYLRSPDDNRTDNARNVDRCAQVKQLKSELKTLFSQENALSSNEFNINDFNRNDAANIHYIDIASTNPNDPAQLDSMLESSPFMFFGNIYSKLGYGFHDSITLDSNDSDFIFNQLRSFVNRTTESKDDNLLCGAFTLKNEAEGRRRVDIHSLFGHFFDFDTPRWMFQTDLNVSSIEGITSKGVRGWYYTNEESAKKEIESLGILCTEVPRITVRNIQDVVGFNTRVLLHSTYSGGNRCRAFMLYDQPVSPEQHTVIARSIYKKIMKRNPHCHMDWSGTRPESIFWLPCQSKHRNETFIEESGTGLFRVDEYLAFATPAPEIRSPQSFQVVIAETRVDDEDTYTILIQPILDTMKDHNRFIPGQRAVGLCKTHCYEQKYRLFDEMRERGVSRQHLNDFERLWARS